MSATPSAVARVGAVASPWLLCTLLLLMLLLATWPVHAELVHAERLEECSANLSLPAGYGKGRKGLKNYLSRVWNLFYTDNSLDKVARRQAGPSLTVNGELESLVDDAKPKLFDCMGSSPWPHIKTRLSQQVFIKHLLDIGGGEITKSSFEESLDDLGLPQKPSGDDWKRLKPAERAEWDKLNQADLWNELVQWRTRQAVRSLGKEAGLNDTVARKIAINVSSYPDAWDQSKISEEHIHMFFKEDLTLLPTFSLFVQKLAHSMSNATDRAQALVDEVRATLRDPSVIDQATMGFCGPSAVLHMLAITQPESFVSMATSMFCTMTFKLGDTDIDKPSPAVLERVGISKSIEDVAVETSKLEMRALDWMMTSTLRSHTHVFIDRLASAYTQNAVRTTLLRQWAEEAYPNSTEELVRLYDLNIGKPVHTPIPRTTWTTKVLAKAKADTGLVLLCMEVGSSEHMYSWTHAQNSIHRLSGSFVDKTLLSNGHAVVLLDAKDDDDTCYLFTWAKYVHLPCYSLRIATDWAQGIDVSAASTVSDLGRQRLKELKKQLSKEVAEPLSKLIGNDKWWE